MASGLKFQSAAAVEQIVWQCRLADWPRGQNRAAYNALFNGAPPIPPSEVSLNGQSTNVNFLEATQIDHSARRQLWNAMCVPSPIFTVELDYGPTYKRREWSQIITREINKPIANSPEFLDLRDGVGASMILHGIGPAIWENKYNWCPVELGIEDVLVPSNTLRSLKNLPFIAIYRQYTAPMFYKMTHGPKVDPAWNMPLVEQCLQWVDSTANQLLGSNWPEVWSPEKMEERYKQDSGWYASDSVPTINVYDFYFWNDNGKQSGWNRRMVLDAWGLPGTGGSFATTSSIDDRQYDHGRGKFLYDSGDRVYADKLSKIIHFQFGDASAVAPFRYHSVRSLGFLLYAVCHLQNRLKCRFNDAVFESMLQYFRSNDPNDRDRLQKVDLLNHGILPEGLQFVKREERWEINEALVQQAMNLNRQSMQDSSASFRQDYERSESKEETATEVMAKVNSAAALVGSMINRAYAQERFRQIEICRRFCIKNSKDMDVRKFRNEVMKLGVPPEALCSERWNVQPTKVVGTGNRMLQVAMADKLMSTRQLHNPEAQAEILRLSDAIYTEDWELAEKLNPKEPHISDSVHDTQLAFGSLIGGNPVTPRPGLNAIEVASTMIQLMGNKVQQIMQTGGVGTPQDLIGLQMCAQYTVAFIQQLAQDPEQKPLVKELGDALGQIGNQVKAMAQRQQEMMQQAQENQQNGNGADPKDAAKAQAMVIQAQTKAHLAESSHAEKTAQRQISFEAKLQQDAQKHQADLAKTALETQQNIQLDRMKAMAEFEKTQREAQAAEESNSD